MNKGHAQTHQHVAPIFVGLSGDQPTHHGYRTPFGGAQANDVQYASRAVTIVRKQKHRMSVTHSSPGLHGQGNPLSGTVVDDASSRVGYSEYASSMGPTAISGSKETYRAPVRPQ